MPELQKQKKRRDVGLRLTPRDKTLLRYGGEQYALHFDQSQRLMAKLSPSSAGLLSPGILSESATRHRLDDLEDAGYIVQARRLVDMPSFFYLTTEGYRAAGLPFRSSPPSLDDLEHLYLCVQVRLWLLLNRPELEAVWRSERWLRRELDQKIKQVKLPDAVLQLPTGGAIAIEAERSTKGPTRLVEVLRARVMVYDQVWYICLPGTLENVQEARLGLEPLYQQKLILYEQRQFSHE